MLRGRQKNKSYKTEQFGLYSCISAPFFQLLLPVSLFLFVLLHETFLPPSLPVFSDGHPHRDGSLLKVSALFTSHYMRMLRLEGERDAWQRFMNWYDRNLVLFDKWIRRIRRDLLAEQQNESQGWWRASHAMTLLRTVIVLIMALKKHSSVIGLGFPAEADQCPSVQGINCAFFPLLDLKVFFLRILQSCPS